MRYLTIFLLTVGLFSCTEKNKPETRLVIKPDAKPVTQSNDFEMLENFKLNKPKFRPDTLQLLDHSTDGGELIVYHDKDYDYVVMDFWLYGETGKLNYTYWTDNDFHFKFVRKINYKYDKPYYEEGFKVDTVTQYLTYSKSECRLFDSFRKEVTDKDLVDSTKTELEVFYKDVTQGIKLIK